MNEVNSLILSNYTGSFAGCTMVSSLLMTPYSRDVIDNIT